MEKVLRLSDAAVRIGKSERTLWRWQTEGLIRILPGGWIRERDLVRAEAEMRKRHLMKKYGAT